MGGICMEEAKRATGQSGPRGPEASSSGPHISSGHSVEAHGSWTRMMKKFRILPPPPAQSPPTSSLGDT